MKKIPVLLKVLPLLVACTVAQAKVYHFNTWLSGAAEAPPNASPGVGSANIWVDDVANTMLVQVWFAGLWGGVTASHIHASTAMAWTGTAVVATQTPTFTGFPSGVTAGSYSHLFDLTDPASYRAGYITSHGGTAASAEASLLGGMKAGRAYLNIHTDKVPSGEIRGFLVLPDSGSTAALLGLAMVTMAGFARRYAARRA